jgi:hypothetical protein
VGAVTAFAVGLATVFGVVAGVVAVIGFAVEAADALVSGVGIGVVSRNGVGVSIAAGIKGNASDSDGAREAAGVSIGSGVALANGRIVAVGDDFGFTLDLTVAVGEAFGFGLGDGDSTAAGVRDWNGVEAASCALTRAVEMSKTVAKTNRRMMSFFTEI